MRTKSCCRFSLCLLLWTTFQAIATKSSSNFFFFPRQLLSPVSEETPRPNDINVPQRPRFLAPLLDRTSKVSSIQNDDDDVGKTKSKETKRRRNSKNAVKRSSDETNNPNSAQPSNPFSFLRRAVKQQQPTTNTTTIVTDTPVAPTNNSTQGFRLPWQRRKTTRESPSSSENDSVNSNITTTAFTRTTINEEEGETISEEASVTQNSTTTQITTTTQPSKTKSAWGIFRKQKPTTGTPIAGTNKTESKEGNTTTVSSTDAIDESTSNKTVSLNATKTNDTTSMVLNNQTASKDDEQVTPATHPLPATPGGMVITTTPYGSSTPVPYRYYRKQTPGVPSPPMSQQNSVLIAEVFVSILGTASRLWFLTWLTRRLASQEEVIQPTQHFCWERLNDRYQRDSSALSKALQAPPAGISLGQWKWDHIRKVQARPRKERLDLASVFTRTVVVVELSDDPKEGISLEQMPDLVTFLLQQHRNGAFGTHKSTGRPMEVEILFLVQSPGGGVATFGLAASQMRRLSKVEGITTTAVVDKVAASGGYMIASQAHKLLAAPFSSLGSIGVMMEGLNFNELVEKYGIKPMIVKAGTNKNTLSTFGRVSDKDIRHEEVRLAAVHDAFKELVVEGRPALGDMLDRVADGSVFLGKEAFDLQMVDGIMTSDEYILQRIFANDRVLKLYRSYQARFPRRMLQISPLDLLPHLKAWMKQVDAKQITGLLAAVAQIGGIMGIVQQMLTSGHVKR